MIYLKIKIKNLTGFCFAYLNSYPFHNCSTFNRSITMPYLYQCANCYTTLYGDSLAESESYNFVINGELCSSCQADEDNYDDYDDDD